MNAIHIGQKNRKSHLRTEFGGAMIEAALTVALIAVIAVAAVRNVGDEVSASFTTASAELGDSLPGGSRGGGRGGSDNGL